MIVYSTRSPTPEGLRRRREGGAGTASSLPASRPSTRHTTKQEHRMVKVNVVFTNNVKLILRFFRRQYRHVMKTFNSGPVLFSS
jgi:hypothetical protein